MAPKVKTRKVSRSARTGRFVEKGYADKHPHTTVTETVKVPKKEGKK